MNVYATDGLHTAATSDYVQKSGDTMTGDLHFDDAYCFLMTGHKILPGIRAALETRALETDQGNTSFMDTFATRE